jgi:hypothetical protein
MTTITFASAFRDFEIDGLPSSGEHDVKKSEVRAAGTNLETLISGGALGENWKETRTLLNADLAHADGSIGVVYADPTPSNNGFYVKDGDSGLGSFTQVSTFIPGYQFVVATDAGDGTANAIEATTNIPVSYSDGVQLIRLNIFETNTSSTVTVDFGSGGLRIKTASGNDPAIGGLVAGMIVLGVVDQSATVFRMVSDQASSAIQSAAEAAQAAAEVAQAAAEAATTYNRVAVRFTTTDEGPYDMGVGNTIGSANNLDVKIGGVLQDHNKYTVSGTEFTLTTDPGSGLDMEAVLTSDVRELNTPADSSVGEASLDATLTAKVNKIVTVEDYGVVYDNSAGDRALMHTAAMAAVAAGRPFVVPTRGLVWDEGLVIQVPEDFSTVQEAHDAMLNWIFPATAPKYVDTTQNHLSPVSVTISVSGTVHTHVGTNITWNHPAGNLIRLKGRGKTGLTLASQQAVTYSSGTHPCRLRFSDWPSSDPVAGSVLMAIVLGGSGEYLNFEGGWRITAVNSGNKDITFAAYAREDTTALTSIISSGLFYHIPCVLRFTVQPYSGADSGCIDVHTTLRMSDIAILGDASNASSSNGLIAREGAKILLDQHCAVLEHPRSGLWLLNDAYAQIGFSSFCGNGSGVNNLQSIVDGSRTYIQGNLSYNYIGGIGSSGSIVQAAFGGSGGSGILVNGNASLICSGHSRRSNFGVEAAPGGFVNINDMNVRSNTTVDLRRRGGGRIVVVTADYGTADPAIDTGDSYGGFTALESTLNAVT